MSCVCSCSCCFLSFLSQRERDSKERRVHIPYLGAADWDAVSVVVVGMMVFAMVFWSVFLRVGYGGGIRSAWKRAVVEGVVEGHCDVGKKRF